MFACGCTTIIDAIKGAGSSNAADEGSIPAATYDRPGPRVRPGVVLAVQVSTLAQPPVSMTVQADPEGFITLPYLLQEPVLCKDLTLDALKQKLVKAYQNYIRQPQVTVTFGPYDANAGVSPWGYVTVLGDVGSPGQVNMPPTMDLTVTRVIQKTGGFRPFANKSHVVVYSCDQDGKKTRTVVDVDEIGAKGRIEKDITLQSGDVVWVPESWY